MAFFDLMYGIGTTLLDELHYVTIVFQGKAVFVVSMLGSVHDLSYAERFDASIDARLTQCGWTGFTLVCCVLGFIT